MNLSLYKEGAVTTLIIDRKTLPEPISSRFHSRRIVFQQRYDGGEATLSPVMDESEHAPGASAGGKKGFSAMKLKTKGFKFDREIGGLLL